MSKRRQIAEATTGGHFRDRELDGGPDQTVEPAQVASSERLKERL